MPFSKQNFISSLLKLCRKSYISRWIIFICDILLSVLSVLCVLGLVSYYLKWDYGFSVIGIICLCSCAGAVIGSVAYQSYTCIIRYSTLREVWRILCGIILSSVIFCFLLALIGVLPFYRVVSFTIIYFLFSFFLIFSSRILLLNLYYFLVRITSDKKKNILVYGSGPDSISLSLSKNRFMQKCNVRGFFTSNPSDRRYRIGGFNILHAEKEEKFKSLISKNKIWAIVFPDGSALQIEKDRLIAWCNTLDVRVYVMPGLEEMKDGVIPHYIRPIQIENLLGRDEIEINLKEIGSLLRDKVVLVTGAAGSIGSEICRQLATFGVRQLICFDAAETPTHYLRLELEDKYPDLNFLPIIGDVRNLTRVTTIFERYHPQVVFHAAAYKHVPLMEENPCEAIHTNVMGTKILADTSLKYNVEKFVMISTDKAVNPTNIMGCSKRIAEIYTQSLSMALKNGEKKGNTRFITTRFGNVLGSNGSVIPRFKEQIENGGPVTVTHPDIIRYFMTIPEACRLVLEAGTMGKGGEIFVFDMGEPVKIVDLAKRMIELAGFTPDKEIQLTYTGLRPGEKLYEEPLSDKENTHETENKKIRIAKAREYSYSDVCRVIKILIDYSVHDDLMNMVREMKKFVPEYISQNSRFEKLDHKNSTINV